MLPRTIFRLSVLALFASHSVSADELDNSSWTLSASHNSGAVYNAIDGDSTTRWATQQYQTSGQTFTVNLNQTLTFDSVVLNTDPNPYDYPRSYALQVSDDGETWETVVSGTGDSSETVIEFADQTASYVQIVQLGSSDDRWWSIHEMNIYADSVDIVTRLEALDRSNWSLSSDTNEDDIYNAVDSDLSSRWTTKSYQKAGQNFSIALNQDQTFSRIVLDSEASPYDYPRSYVVSVSNDGETWATVATGEGSSTTVIDFDEQTASYVSIEQLGSAEDRWWSIHEINLYSESEELVSQSEGLLDRSNWSLSSSTTEENIELAIDDYETTRWTTQTPQVSGQDIIIDLNQTQSFDRIVLNSDASPDDYPRSYAVSVSSDGVTWTTVATGDGSDSQTVIEFDEQSASAIKIEQLGSDSHSWWSIYELDVSYGEVDPMSAYHEDIVYIADIDLEDILATPNDNWSDSYSVGDECYCETTYDHDIADIEVETSAGTMTVYEVCTLIGPGPGSEGRPVYNDVQCGNGPANSDSKGDEDYCPGRIDLGKAGCVQIGPTWKIP